MVEVSVPLTADSTLDEHATVLRAYVDQQHAHLARLKQEAVEVQGRITRGEKAIAALAPPEEKPEKPEKTAGKGSKKRPGNPQRQAEMNNWTPSDLLIEKVRRGLIEHGNDYEHGITINRLAEAIGVAGETVKRALEVLRQRGDARFLGIREFPTKMEGRSVKAKAYKPMPQDDSTFDDELSRASEEFVDSLNGAARGSNG